MTRVFISDHPPRNAMLSRYGDAFGAFLDQFAPVRALPYLGDVARIETMLGLKPITLRIKPRWKRQLCRAFPPEQLPSCSYRFTRPVDFLSSPHPALQHLGCA